MVLVLHDGELINGEPLVVLGIVEIEKLRLRATNSSIRPIFHRYAVHEQPMKRTVSSVERCAIKASNFAEGVVYCLDWQRRIDSRERLAQAAC